MKTSTRSKWLFCAAAFALTGAARQAEAQQGLALDRFDPAPAGDRLFGVPSPYAAGHGDIHFSVEGDYAHNPLVLSHSKGVPDVGAVVGDQLVLHLDASIALWNRLNLNVDIPVAVLQNGDTPTRGTTTYKSPDGVDFGDLRVGARFTLLGEYEDLFQLAVGGQLWIPTGQTGRFVSDESLRGQPQLILGGSHDRFVWSFAAGPEFRPSTTFDGVHQGSMLRAGAGVGVLIGDERLVQLGPELSVAVPFEQVEKKNTNAELLLGARYRFARDFEAAGAFGPGLASGIGTPDVRIVLGLSYTPNQKPLDSDGDGVDDEHDACPQTAVIGNADPARPGCPMPPPADRDSDGIPDSADACGDTVGVASDDPMKNGCPSDRDSDGIPDVSDMCPDAAGPAGNDPATMGCPPPADQDADGVPDSVDACPAIKGVQSAVAEANGCPPDTDGDGFRDDQDACPEEKGLKNEDPAKNGCPGAVRLMGDSIVILQQVQFKTGTATIEAASDGLLDEVAGVMKDHAEITKVEIQGHTDNRGNANLNKTLSQKRADAVKAALVTRKIEEGRLVAKGYGAEVPIGDNATDDGRAKNRRVEFKVVERRALRVIQ